MYFVSSINAQDYASTTHSTSGANVHISALTFYDVNNDDFGWEHIPYPISTDDDMASNDDVDEDKEETEEVKNENARKEQDALLKQSH